ncbi:MAG: hypothetical protein IPM97_13825 [Bdellovibrionaceae bacterium]|nr:hypothetical protein [Pseudobdellovibrionaceae bacterium]
MEDIRELALVLKSRNLLPKHVEFSNCYNVTIVSAYDETSSEFISESVSMGIDPDTQIAFAKAIVEYNERKISKKSSSAAIKATSRSDGLAAFPVYNRNQNVSKVICQKHAFLEAAERFLWATWWDNSKIAFEINLWRPLILDPLTVDSIKNTFAIKSLRKITIRPNNSSVILTILLAENFDGGFITGGAASFNNEITDAEKRSFGELLRHLIAYEKIKTEYNIESLSFYERRLYGFGSGMWRELVLNRLNSNSKTLIALPELNFDEVIEHPNDDIISIHRCLFRNQPVFMGGKEDRLCI